ncbi:MAG: DNA cytosine methyltransferase [Treponema sp.]|nr:DNA cytosine methyltransferase [Treponema sp.]
MENVLNCIDLFCGCGGLSLGFEKAGINVLVGIDAWQDAITTFNYNHKNSKGICADLSTLEPSEIKKELNGKSVDLIIGGPPCQGFSVAGKRIVDDVRNKLYKNFVRFVEYYKPKAFMMENVPNILSIGGGIVSDSIVKDFSDLGYKVVYQVLIASNYGTPQNRRRAVFVGFKNGFEFKFPEKTVEKLITSSEALSDLPENSLEDGTPYPIASKCDYQKLMRCNSDKVYNHQITEHNERTKEIIALVPDGGNYKNLPEELQQTRKVHIAWTRLNSQKPSFTIDTGHRHHFHYKWNRIPTVRESARIQSFPDDFIFLGTKTSQYKQVGNAVPPLMAEAIAKKIKESLNV